MESQHSCYSGLLGVPDIDRLLAADLDDRSLLALFCINKTFAFFINRQFWESKFRSLLNFANNNTPEIIPADRSLAEVKKYYIQLLNLNIQESIYYTLQNDLTNLFKYYLEELRLQMVGKIIDEPRALYKTICDHLITKKDAKHLAIVLNSAKRYERNKEVEEQLQKALIICNISNFKFRSFYDIIAEHCISYYLEKQTTFKISDLSILLFQNVVTTEFTTIQ